MLISNSLSSRMNQVNELADKEGLIVVTVIVNAETEETKVLCDPSVGNDNAIFALEMLVDGIRAAREQQGDQKTN